MDEPRVHAVAHLTRIFSSDPIAIQAAFYSFDAVMVASGGDIFGGRYNRADIVEFARTPAPDFAAVLNYLVIGLPDSNAIKRAWSDANVGKVVAVVGNQFVDGVAGLYLGLF